MGDVLSIGELALSDPLDSMFENLKPVPRIEVTETQVRFVDLTEIRSYQSIWEALEENNEFSGVIHFNCNWDESVLLSRPTSQAGEQRNITFDLDHFTLKVETGTLFVGGKKITFLNGKLISNEIIFTSQSNAEHVLCFDNVEVDIVNGGGIRVEGWKVEVKSGSRIYPCYTEDMGFKKGIALGGNASLVVEDGALIQNDFGSCVFMVEHQGNIPSVVLNGGSIIGKTGLYVMDGSIEVPYYSNVIVVGTGNGLITSDGGDVGHAIAVYPTNEESQISFSINAGKFFGINKAPVGSYSNGVAHRITKFMNGGILDRFPSTNASDPDYDILADGCYGQAPCRIMRAV